MPHSPLTLRTTLLTLGSLFAGLVLVAFLSLALGTTRTSFGEVVSALFRTSDHSSDAVRTIILQIRLPRVLLAMIVGAGLSVAGATFQALLRNPLAEPYILGISSGGTVGALVAMTLGLGASQFLPPLFSFLGSSLVMLLVFTLGYRRGSLDTNALLLSGIMVGAFFSAMVLLFTAMMNQDIRTTYLWLIGNLGAAEIRSVALLLPLMILAAGVLIAQARFFNLIATGDETAMHLGVEVELFDGLPRHGAVRVSERRYRVCGACRATCLPVDVRPRSQAPSSGLVSCRGDLPPVVRSPLTRSPLPLRNPGRGGHGRYRGPRFYLFVKAALKGDPHGAPVPGILCVL